MIACCRFSTLLPLVFDSIVLYDCVSTIEDEAPKCYPVMKDLVATGICLNTPSTGLGHGDASMMFSQYITKKTVTIPGIEAIASLGTRNTHDQGFCKVKY